MIQKFYESFWNHFVEQFYNNFVKGKPREDQRYGFIALPSNKKVNFFFKYLNFKDFISKIIGNEEIEFVNYHDSNLQIKKFDSQSVFNRQTAMQMFSVFSSPAIGINVPHVFYLNVSINNYHPSHVEYEQAYLINDTFISAEYEIIINSLKQIQGRLTRRLEGEDQTIRIIELKKKPPKEGMCFFILYMNNLAQISNSINIINLEEYENLIFIILKSIKIKSILNIYNKYIKYDTNDDLDIDFLEEIFSEFKISLIKLLKSNVEVDQVKSKFFIISNEFLILVFKFVDKVIITLFYQAFYLNKKDDKKIKTFSQIKQSLSIFSNSTFSQFFDKYSELYMILKRSENESIDEFLETYNDLNSTFEDIKYIEMVNNELNKSNETFIKSY